MRRRTRTPAHRRSHPRAGRGEPRAAGARGARWRLRLRTVPQRPESANRFRPAAGLVRSMRAGSPSCRRCAGSRSVPIAVEERVRAERRIGGPGCLAEGGAGRGLHGGVHGHPGAGWTRAGCDGVTGHHRRPLVRARGTGDAVPAGVTDCGLVGAPPSRRGQGHAAVHRLRGQSRQRVPRLSRCKRRRSDGAAAVCVTYQHSTRRYSPISGPSCTAPPPRTRCR